MLLLIIFCTLNAIELNAFNSIHFDPLSAPNDKYIPQRELVQSNRIFSNNRVWQNYIVTLPLQHGSEINSLRLSETYKEARTFLKSRDIAGKCFWGIDSKESIKILRNMERKDSLKIDFARGNCIVKTARKPNQFGRLLRS